MWLLATCLLIGVAVGLSCCLFDLRHLVLEPAGSCDPIYLWGLHYYPKEFPNCIENLLLRVLVAFDWSRDGQKTMKRQPKPLFSGDNGKKIWSWTKGIDRNIEIETWSLCIWLDLFHINLRDCWQSSSFFHVTWVVLIVGIWRKII